MNTTIGFWWYKSALPCVKNVSIEIKNALVSDENGWLDDKNVSIEIKNDLNSDESGWLDVKIAPH